LPQQVYIAWLPSVLRTICRTLSIVLVNLLSVLLFDLTMVLSGSKMHSGLATLLCFLTFQSILIALIYSTLEMSLKTSDCRGNFRCSSVLLDSATR
jgi:uncharacterized membrane protein